MPSVLLNMYVTVVVVAAVARVRYSFTRKGWLSTHLTDSTPMRLLRLLERESAGVRNDGTQGSLERRRGSVHSRVEVT